MMFTRKFWRGVITVTRLAALALLVIGAAACGYSEEEWQAQLDKYHRLQSQHQSTAARLAKVEQELGGAQARVLKLEGDLKAAGVDIGKLHQDLATRGTEISSLSTRLEEREKALAEYKKRAAQLERIRRRFEQLRNKLNALTSLGLAVKIRHNRMIISLPGDVLFSSGRDNLKDDGKDILLKVAQVINGDASLRARYYQVGGHTDNKPLRGGPFRDNLGLSLMRARTVLLFLINPDKTKGGGLPKSHWSAAGFAETDPVASNDTADGRQQNRRCELVVMPSVEEMLDLKSIAR